ncbi:MAG: hypothetical protein K5840_05595 [Eubacterium sp.]|nr:hypothetical protein [Eubacterium sp.]
MSEKVNQIHWWQRITRNVVKVWRVVYVPMRYFFIGEGADELNEEARRAEEEEKAAQEAAEEPVDEAPEVEEPVSDDSGDDFDWGEGTPVSAGAEETAADSDEEEEVDMSGLSDDEADLAASILARLQAEAAEDEAKKAAEIAEAREFAENKERSDFNAATNSFSGQYGTGPVDDDTMDAVSAILKQNDRSSVDDILGG